MVLLFGDQSNVDRSKNALLKLTEDYHRKMSRQQTSVAERLRARQGGGLTYDWRVLPVTSVTAVAGAGGGAAGGGNLINHPGSSYNGSNSGFGMDGNSNGGVVNMDILLRHVCAMSSSSSLMAANGWPLPSELLSTAGATSILTYDRKSAQACLAFTNQPNNTHSAHR